MYGFLNYIRKKDKSVPYGLSVGKTRIGTSSIAEIRLKSKTSLVDPEHCIINVDDNGCATLLNNSTKAPVMVNSVPIKNSILLKSGDKFEVGKKMFEYINEKEELKQSQNEYVRTKRNSVSTSMFRTRIPIKLSRSSADEISPPRRPTLLVKAKTTSKIATSRTLRKRLSDGGIPLKKNISTRNILLTGGKSQKFDRHVFIKEESPEHKPEMKVGKSTLRRKSSTCFNNLSPARGRTKQIVPIRRSSSLNSIKDRKFLDKVNFTSPVLCVPNNSSAASKEMLLPAPVSTSKRGTKRFSLPANESSVEIHRATRTRRQSVIASKTSRQSCSGKIMTKTPGKKTAILEPFLNENSPVLETATLTANNNKVKTETIHQKIYLGRTRSSLSQLETSDHPLPISKFRRKSCVSKIMTKTPKISVNTASSPIKSNFDLTNEKNMLSKNEDETYMINKVSANELYRKHGKSRFSMPINEIQDTSDSAGQLLFIKKKRRQSCIGKIMAKTPGKEISAMNFSIGKTLSPLLSDMVENRSSENKISEEINFISFESPKFTNKSPASDLNISNNSLSPNYGDPNQLFVEALSSPLYNIPVQSSVQRSRGRPSKKHSKILSRNTTPQQSPNLQERSTMTCNNALQNANTSLLVGRTPKQLPSARNQKAQSNITLHEGLESAESPLQFMSANDTSPVNITPNKSLHTKSTPQQQFSDNFPLSTIDTHQQVSSAKARESLLYSLQEDLISLETPSKSLSTNDTPEQVRSIRLRERPSKRSVGSLQDATFLEISNKSLCTNNIPQQVHSVKTRERSSKIAANSLKDGVPTLETPNKSKATNTPQQVSSVKTQGRRTKTPIHSLQEDATYLETHNTTLHTNSSSQQVSYTDTRERSTKTPIQPSKEDTTTLETSSKSLSTNATPQQGFSVKTRGRLSKTPVYSLQDGLNSLQTPSKSFSSTVKTRGRSSKIHEGVKSSETPRSLSTNDTSQQGSSVKNLGWLSETPVYPFQEGVTSPSKSLSTNINVQQVSFAKTQGRSSKTPVHALQAVETTFVTSNTSSSTNDTHEQMFSVKSLGRPSKTPEHSLQEGVTFLKTPNKSLSTKNTPHSAGSRGRSSAKTEVRSLKTPDYSLHEVLKNKKNITNQKATLELPITNEKDISVISVSDTDQSDILHTPENNTSVIILDESLKISPNKRKSKRLAKPPIQKNLVASTPKSVAKSRPSKLRTGSERDIVSTTGDKTRIDEIKEFKTPMNTPEVFERIRKSAIKSRSGSTLSADVVSKTPAVTNNKRKRESTASGSRINKKVKYAFSSDGSNGKDEEDLFDTSCDSFFSSELDNSQYSDKMYPELNRISSPNSSLESIKTETGSNSLTDHSVSRVKKSSKSPLNDLSNISGVRGLLKSPQNAPKNDLTDVQGVKKMFKTPKEQRLPTNDLTNIPNLKYLMSPKKVKSPRNDLSDVGGVKKLMKSPKIQKSPRNDLVKIPNLRNIIYPRTQNSPKNDLTNIPNIRKLMSPKDQKSPKNDLTNIPNIRKWVSPRERVQPKNDLSNVHGLKTLMRTPKINKEPLNDLSDVDNIGNLFNVSHDKVSSKTPVKDIGSSEDEFSRVFNKEPLRTYRFKSMSPEKQTGNNCETIGDIDEVASSPHVEKWLNDIDLLQRENKTKLSIEKEKVRKTPRKTRKVYNCENDNKVTLNVVNGDIEETTPINLRRRGSFKKYSSDEWATTAPKQKRHKKNSTGEDEQITSKIRRKKNVEAVKIYSPPDNILEQAQTKFTRSKANKVLHEKKIQQTPTRTSRRRKQKEQSSEIVDQSITKRQKVEKPVPDKTNDIEKKQNTLTPPATRSRRGTKTLLKEDAFVTKPQTRTKLVKKEDKTTQNDEKELNSTSSSENDEEKNVCFISRKRQNNKKGEEKDLSSTSGRRKESIEKDLRPTTGRKRKNIKKDEEKDLSNASGRRRKESIEKVEEKDLRPTTGRKRKGIKKDEEKELTKVSDKKTKDEEKYLRATTSRIKEQNSIGIEPTKSGKRVKFDDGKENEAKEDTKKPGNALKKQEVQEPLRRSKRTRK